MRPKPENQLSLFTAYMCLLSVYRKRQLGSQQTVYRGPDGKQLYTLRSLCPLLQNPVVTVSEKPHKQHVNKLVQPCCNKTSFILNKHRSLCGPRAITCRQQNTPYLFSRKRLIQLGFPSFRERTEKTCQVRLHFCFSVGPEPTTTKNILTCQVLTYQLCTAATN